MQDYCGQYKTEKTLQVGLRLLKELRESEALNAYAANPHELARIAECQSIITAGEAVIHASLARKASSDLLNFVRLDFPSVDPPEWQKLLPIKLVNGEVSVGELPFDYYLKPPYAPTYEENYNLHCDL
jgi:succinate dehydrogenase/fumarate reductase flavoprotein subunit